MMDDIRDILGTRGERTSNVGRKRKRPEAAQKRPEGMHRELYALLTSEGKMNMELAPLLPTEQGGYKEKIKLGAKVARSWKWTPFSNPARKDGAIFHHWRRATDENKDYPFAKFNKEVPIHQYSESEYNNHLEQEGWNKEETDYLFDLCRRFDLRFPIIQDRWPEKGRPRRSIEDLKERYYNVTNALNKLRSEVGSEVKVINYDADHERRRKEQMDKLWKRTPEQVEEEEYLRAELKKIDLRKKERDKKTQDLQKLITAADGLATPPIEPQVKKSSDQNKKKKKSGGSRREPIPTDFSAIKWPDFKNAGVTMRSQRIKLPSSVGQKKSKAIEHILHQLGIDQMPTATGEITQQFNELRTDIVLLYELKSALQTCEIEIQSLAGQHEGLSGVKLDVPTFDMGDLNFDTVADYPSRNSVPFVQVPGLPETPTPPLNKKRKAALEQVNIMKKLKSKNYTDS